VAFYYITKEKVCGIEAVFMFENLICIFLYYYFIIFILFFPKIYENRIRNLWYYSRKKCAF